jgi:DNA (cytosine-5)-methyltransferase 1
MPKNPSASHIMNEVSKKSVAEFFAGIGLMRIGLERAGWDVAWANDIDTDKASIYRNHFRDTDDHLLVQDVHLLDADRIPTVTLATASFPCTDLSLAGERRGLAGIGSGAFWGFIKAIEGMGTRRPPLVLLENVTGFLTSKNGADFRDACLALNDLGYVVDAFILDAAQHLPQSRKRLFVVGSLEPAVDRRPKSAPLVFASHARPEALVDVIASNPSISWSIRELPSVPPNKMELADVLEDIDPASDIWWDAKRARYLLGQMSPKHRAIADDMIAARKSSCGTIFRRVRKNVCMAELRVDGIAGCLRTPRGGSGRQILFVAGNGEYRARLLTPRE